jgi:RNA polymerase sigma-70 factor (ECF subfamily)
MEAPPPPPDSGQRERAIREHCAQGKFDLAIAAAWREYRTEMLHFLAGALRDEDAAQEVFSAFSEELWKSLPRFRWESSFRTWGYRLLRAACFRYMHSPKRRETPVSSPIAADHASPSRSATNPWQRTDVKDGLSELRETLEPSDQLLLLLRVNQKLPWTEIAQIVDEGDGPMTPEDLRKKSAALRQHFHRVKDQLRKLAEERGLLSPDP